MQRSKPVSTSCDRCRQRVPTARYRVINQSASHHTRTVQFEIGTDALLEAFLRSPDGDRASPPYFGGTPIFGAHRLPTPMLCNEREKIMIRLFGILALVAGVAGCVAAQQPYEGYGGPGYPPRISIGIGIGGGFNW